MQEPEVTQRVDSSGDNGRSDGGDSGTGSQDGRSTRGRHQEVAHGTAKVRYLLVLLFFMVRSNGEVMRVYVRSRVRSRFKTQC